MKKSCGRSLRAAAGGGADQQPAKEQTSSRWRDEQATSSSRRKRNSRWRSRLRGGRYRPGSHVLTAAPAGKIAAAPAAKGEECQAGVTGKGLLDLGFQPGQSNIGKKYDMWGLFLVDRPNRCD